MKKKIKKHILSKKKAVKKPAPRKVGIKKVKKSVKKIKTSKKISKPVKNRNIKIRKTNKKLSNNKRIKKIVKNEKKKEIKTVPLILNNNNISFPLDVEQGDIIHKTKIRVIGIGGGGGTIVSEIASRIKKADFYIANTDNRSLAEPIKKVKKFQFGLNTTKGFGTGMNSQLGEAAANEDKERIKKILEGQDLCIIIACLGGGTSSGATPIFAKISRDLGNLTYGIFTMPFEFEGEKKMEAAFSALEKIKPNLNVYSVIPNERIFEIVDKNTPLKSALSAINKKLADNLEGLIEMIYLPGMINIDFADLKTILSGRGRLAYLNAIDIDEPQKEETIKKLISSPIYPYTSKGAKGILYNINSSKEIQLSEVSQISNTIAESVSKDAKIIFGINQSPKYQNKIKITLLATGCSGKGFIDKPVIFKGSGLLASSLHEEVAVAKANPAANPNYIEQQNQEVKKMEKKKKIIKTKKAEPALKSKAKPKIEKKNPIIKSILKKPIENPIPTRIAIQNLDGGKVRKNALQVKKETEEEEKEILDQEKIWDVPAILRRKDFENQ